MNPRKLIIVGGVAGGATAATRSRRLDEFAEIVLFERGEYISFANCGLPYYVGGTIKDRKKLMVTTPEVLQQRYRIDVRTAHEVLSIDPTAKRVEVRDLKKGRTFYESYDQLILSPGAEPILPSVETIYSERVFTLRNIPDTDRMKEFIDTEHPKSAVVVGGGFIGMEMVENLVERRLRTTVIEMADQVMPVVDIEMAAVVHAALREKGVQLELGQKVTGFHQDEERISVSTDLGKSFDCDMVLIAIGVNPENTLMLEAGLAVGARGGVITDQFMRTSDPNIFAVGDVVEVKNFIDGRPAMIPLAGPANKQGRIAADNAMGRKSIFKYPD